jgi:hypothetical protein
VSGRDGHMPVAVRLGRLLLALLPTLLLLPLLADAQGLFGIRKRDDTPNPRNRDGVAAAPGSRVPRQAPAPPTGPPAPERERPLPTGNAVVLDRADQMRTMELDGRPVRELQGNVRVFHNGRVFTFGLGRYDQEGGLLTCMDQVKVVEGTRWLTADEVSYDERRETLSARGHVHSWGDSLEGWAEKGHWLNGLKQGELQVSARIKDHHHKVELRAGLVEADHERGVYTATRQPELTLLEEPPTVLNARRIQWRSTDSTAVAVKDVRLKRDDFQASCDSLVWKEQVERMEFHLSPVLKRGARRVTGDRMTALLRGREELDSLWVEGSARMDSPADSVSKALRDVLQGRRMELDFDEDKLLSVYVDGQARSVIFLKDEDGRPGMNVADAAKVWLEMDDQRLKSVRMSGGLEARWVPLQPPPDGGAGLQAAPAEEEPAPLPETTPGPEVQALPPAAEPAPAQARTAEPAPAPAPAPPPAAPPITTPRGAAIAKPPPKP